MCNRNYTGIKYYVGPMKSRAVIVVFSEDLYENTRLTEWINIVFEKINYKCQIVSILYSRI